MSILNPQWARQLAEDKQIAAILEEMRVARFLTAHPHLIAEVYVTALEILSDKPKRIFWATCLAYRPILAQRFWTAYARRSNSFFPSKCLTLELMKAHTIAFLSNIGNFWCRLTHHELMWPNRSRYQCRRCLRYHLVPWAN